MAAATPKRTGGAAALTGSRESSTLKRPLLLRSALVLAFFAAATALICGLFIIDVSEYGLVMRFGRVVRVVAEPGLYVTLPFDKVVRVDKRILFSRPAQSEYLTTDKKNVVVQSLITWRVADPQRFVTSFASPAAARTELADVVVAEIGAVMGRYPASVLIATEPTENRYQAMLAEITDRVESYTLPAYGIEVLSVDLARLSLPEQNREHVFDRMQAERAKMAKENRSTGELQAKKIIAEADAEKNGIDAEAGLKAERIKAEADAEATRIYAAAFAQEPRLYYFLRSLRAYDKLLDDKTTVFLPADTDLLRMLHFEPQPPAAAPPAVRDGVVGAPASPEASAGAGLWLEKKSEPGVQ